MATETATFTLTADAASTIDDPSSSAGATWRDSMATVSQQPGFQQAHYGRQLENADMMQLYIEWDSYDAHQTFVKSAQYKPFVEEFMTLVKKNESPQDGGLEMRHVHFTPHPPAYTTTTTKFKEERNEEETVEVLTLFTADPQPDHALESDFRKFVTFIVENASTCWGASAGWTIEEVDLKAGQGKAFVVMLGWESRAAHLAFRETRGFQDHVHLIRNEKVKAVEVHHTTFVKV